MQAITTTDGIDSRTSTVRVQSAHADAKEARATGRTVVEIHPAHAYAARPARPGDVLGVYREGNDVFAVAPRKSEPTIVGYGSYGTVRGLGERCSTIEDAERSVRADRANCAKVKAGGYSDREVVAVDHDGWRRRFPESGAPGPVVMLPGGSRGVRY